MDGFAKFLLIFITISIFVIIALGDDILDFLEYLIEDKWKNNTTK